MTQGEAESALDWALAKKQTALAIDALSAAEYRSLLRGCSTTSRQLMASLLSPHLAELVEKELASEPSSSGEHLPRPLPSRAEVEIVDQSRRIRMPERPGRKD